MMLREVDARTAKGWLDQGRAVLIDIRESDEYAREHILGSQLVPLSGFDAADFPRDHDKIAVFHCASGDRTGTAAPQILGRGFKEVYQLKDGLSGWKRAGLPTHLDRKAPISIMRQVQIVAGSFVLLGVLLGWLVSPWFYGLSAFVGAGLAFAGISGTCAMANLLRLLPYNRRALETPA
ncbi:MAG: rhodanese-like domain-containing protein [Kiloniellales bacterium]|nr:rhodanese-like domain-containing protein [Kiloniellales bacterium]